MDRLDLLRNLIAIRDAVSPQEEKKLLSAIAADLPMFESDVRRTQKELDAMPDMTNEAITEERKRRQSREGISASAVQEGKQAFQGVRCSALAIFAVPHQRGNEPEADLDAKDIARVEPLIRAFQKTAAEAKIVRIPHANHYVFNSNEADVIRLIDEFVVGLKD